MATLIKIDRNGSKHYEGLVDCPKCGGGGIYYIWVVNGVPAPSWVENGICFQCGGKGKVMGKWIERTPEYEARLEAQRKAQEEAERKAREEAEAQRKARSSFYGQVGDKVDLDLTYIGSPSFERTPFCGYGVETVYIHTFEDSNGNIFVWKTTTNTLGRFSDDKLRDWIPLEKGSPVHLRGTIKEHSEYRDAKQTILTRCKVTF